MKTVRGLDAAIKVIGNAFGVIGLLGVIVILIASSAEIIARKIFSAPIPGTIDTIAYMMVFATFLPLAYARRRGEMISIRVVVDRLPKSWGTAHARFVSFADLAVAVMLLIAAVAAFFAYQSRGVITLGQFPIPFAYLAAVMAVGLLVLVLEILIELFRGDAPERTEPVEGSTAVPGTGI